MERVGLIAMFTLSVAVLTGCGGGGGYGGYGGGGGGNLMSAPGEATINAYFQASHSATLNASSGANNFQLQISRVPGATTTFEGTANAHTLVTTLNLLNNGVLVVNAITTGYFLVNPYVPLGSTSSTGTPYGVVTSSYPLPANFTVGGSGPVLNLTSYHDSTKAIVDISETGTYSITANNYTTLFACLDATLSNVTAQGTADGLVNATESDCYTVDAAGNAALVSITLSVNGTVLKFQ